MKSERKGENEKRGGMTVGEKVNRKAGENDMWEAGENENERHVKIFLVLFLHKMVMIDSYLSNKWTYDNLLCNNNELGKYVLIKKSLKQILHV